MKLYLVLNNDFEGPEAIEAIVSSKRCLRLYCVAARARDG